MFKVLITASFALITMFVNAETASASPTCNVYKVAKKPGGPYAYWSAYGESSKVKSFMRSQAKSTYGHVEVYGVLSGGNVCGVERCCPKPGGYPVERDFGKI